MGLGDVWNRFWFTPTPLVRLALFRILSGWLLFYDAFLYDPRGAVWVGENTAEATWRPIYIFELLGLDRPSASLAQTIHALQIGAIVCATLGFRTRTAWFVATILGFWSGGVVYSLTKVRHDRVALFFASAALSLAPSGARLSIDALLARHRGLPRAEACDPLEQSVWALWPIRLTQVTIAIGYCAAGLAKLSAPGWTNGYTLQGIMLYHHGPWAELAASKLWICRLLSWATLAVETGFPALLIWPRLTLVFVPAAFAFHLGTWATMDTGPYMTLWFFLIAFAPLETVFFRGAAEPARRAWKQRLAAVAVILWLALAVAVMLEKVPAAGLGALIAATLLVLWACARRRGSSETA